MTQNKKVKPLIKVFYPEFEIPVNTLEKNIDNDNEDKNTDTKKTKSKPNASNAV